MDVVLSELIHQPAIDVVGWLLVGAWFVYFQINHSSVLQRARKRRRK